MTAETSVAPTAAARGPAPKVLVFTTGGTISMRLAAGADPFDQTALGASIDRPGIALEFRSILDKGSKDIVPADWETIAAAIAAALPERPAGVVVMHGTDTMHYTAAALSFLLQGLSVPVVLTGSMIPGGDPGSDSVPNLRDAVTVAAHADIGEVCIVFSADRERSSGVILRGNRARKVHSHAVDAFASVNFDRLGIVAGEQITIEGSPAPRSSEMDTHLAAGLDTRVALVKLTPATTPEVLERCLSGLSGAVLEGTGIGHLKEDLHPVIERFGRPVVISTQVPEGGERLGLYPTDAHTLALPNVIPGGAMTSETALVKLIWALGRPGDVRSLMQTNVAGER